MEMIKGKNGVPIADNGSCWRAFGSPNVQSPQIYDYMSHAGPTGIKYGMGFDSVANGTRIAFVDYPKTLYTLEEVKDGDETLTILTRCNVCSAMDQAAARSGKAPYESSLPALPSVTQVRSDLSPASSERLSAGPVAAATLPKWLPGLVAIAKPFALKPTGDLVFSFGLSILADIASGFAPVEYRRALQAFSDNMIDTIDPHMVEHIREDALNIAEAALKDGDSIMSRKFLTQSLFKTRGDLKNEVSRAKLASQSGSSSPQSSSPVYDNRESGTLRTVRLWDG